MGRKIKGAAKGSLPRRACRPIPAGRMARGYAGLIQGTGSNRRGTGGRRAKPTKTIQGFQGGEGLIRLPRRHTGGKRHQPAQHIHEKPRKRQVRPFRLGGHVKQHNPPGAARLRRDQRRAICEPRPATLSQSGRRLSQNLPFNGDLGRRGQPSKGRMIRKGGQRLRLFPGQHAAQLAFTRAQRHGQ